MEPSYVKAGMILAIGLAGESSDVFFSLLEAEQNPTGGDDILVVRVKSLLAESRVSD